MYLVYLNNFPCEGVAVDVDADTLAVGTEMGDFLAFRRCFLRGRSCRR